MFIVLRVSLKLPLDLSSTGLRDANNLYFHLLVPRIHAFKSCSVRWAGIREQRRTKGLLRDTGEGEHSLEASPAERKLL